MRLTILIVLFPIVLYAQSPTPDPVYVTLVDSAFVLLKNAECKPCLTLYEQAFERSRHSALSHLRAAVCAEKCGKRKKAAVLSQKAVEIDWSVCDQVLGSTERYPELAGVYKMSFGADLKQSILRKATQSGINYPLMLQLKKISKDDQLPRQMVDSINSNFLPDSPEYQAFMKFWEETDSLNMLKVDSIIAKFGYPGQSMVGTAQASAAWLVIQHAPLEKQEQYLPMIEVAAQKGEIPKSNWALLLDRVRMRKGQTQLYGSQVVRDETTGAWMFHPIEDEAHVNDRRAAIGMGPLEEYARHFGFDWVPPKGK